MLCDPGKIVTQNTFLGTVKNTVFLGEYIDCEVTVEKQLFSIKVSPDIEVSVGNQVGIIIPRESWVILPKPPGWQ